MSTRSNRLGSAYQAAKDGTYRPWRSSVTASAAPSAGDVITPPESAGYPYMPGSKERGGTSEAAAQAIAPAASYLRGRVLASLREHPATADECASRLDLDILSVRPRLSELSRLGLIVKTGERRANRSGALANVWRAPS
jgi:predicted Rossmann fold nucleotide-binding protein DprA/Smf involved in DNA uptake